MENQKLFLYIALAFLLYIIWLTWQQEHASVPVTQQNNTLQQNVELSTDANNSKGYENSDDLPDASDSPRAANNVSNATGGTVSQSKSQKVHVRTNVLDVIIDTRGGDIRQIDLPTYPVSLEQKDEAFRLMFSNNRTYIAQSGLRHVKVNGQAVSGVSPTHHEIYQAEQTEYLLGDERDELEVKLFWSGENGISVEKIFTFYQDAFYFDVKHRVVNKGNTSWVGQQYQQLRHSPISENRSWLRLPTYTGTAYFDGAYHKHKFSDVEDEPINMQVDGGWIAVLQHYFVSAWIPEGEEQNRFYSKTVKAAGEEQILIGMLSKPQTVTPQSSVEFKRRLYAGPKIQSEMKEISEGLDLSVDYGIFSIISKPLFWLLQWFYNLIGNWGLAIILVTVVVKLIFYKLSETSYKSMARMRKLQPRIKALQERHTDDKQKLGQATWELYRKEKVNPAKGCLPILIQMPVFLALYWVLIESVELRQAPFMFWIQDLSIRDPIFVLPFLMGISMFVQFKLNPAPPDPMQAKIFAMMPIMMTIFMAFFPAGLVLYWLVNNILSIMQQYVITKRIEKEAY